MNDFKDWPFVDSLFFKKKNCDLDLEFTCCVPFTACKH